MSVDIHPVNPRGVLSITFFDDVNEVDIDQMGKAGVAAAQNGVVYVIVDFSGIASLPRNLMNTALRSSALLAFAAHPNAHFFVFISPGDTLKFVLETVFRSVPYEIVDDYDAGIALLHKEVIPNDRQAM